jgi:hypothetical protein
MLTSGYKRHKKISGEILAFPIKLFSGAPDY